MSGFNLPPTSWAPVTTRRLRAPQVLWTSGEETTAGFDAGQVYCCPQDYESPEAYTDETRQEWADRYGGIGVATAGGSGRCSGVNGLQTKGVGVTPLVSPCGDRFHSSGTLMLVEAATEAVFAGAYQAALPYGAVPVHAVIFTGGSFKRELDHDSQAQCLRALAVRPWVARPAHFMRNLLHPAGRLPAGPAAPGWTVDALRTRLAQASLAGHLRHLLSLDVLAEDEIALLDQGFRELARRHAWQCAASFAKRLPHGTLGCSNIALDGAFLDFGIANHVPAYRRLCWAMNQEPWTEAQFPLSTLASLRQQLDKYRPGVRGAAIVGVEEMAALYGQALQARLGIEMARMAGLTEDMALACPPELLARWLKVMQAIWMRGAGERFSQNPGSINGRPAPAPRQGRYDLNAVLAAAGPHGKPEAMDAALRPWLDDTALRQHFVLAATAVRAWLQSWVGSPSSGLDAYLGRQAARKNATMPLLQRDANCSLSAIRQLEMDGDVARVGGAIEAALLQARQTLSDLCPALPGETGRAQVQALCRHGPSPLVEVVPALAIAPNSALGTDERLVC
ncbi:hypothetical protein [Roseateles sp. LYH14W]|uniref:Uncharacterized protein n=1 Tax=Pelomonas parva TaxID=3299032 RepID=A0ABW7EWG0_9BURK